MKTSQSAADLGADYPVAAAARDWLRAGWPVYWLTVLRTWGSSPRPAGSVMALRGDGVVAGSVSGGCLEEDLAEQARAGGWLGPAPHHLTFGVDGASAARAGLPCGGRLEVLLEVLTPGADGGLVRLAESLEGRRPVRRSVNLADGAVDVEEVVAEGVGEGPALVAEETMVSHLLGPTWRLLLVGAGHLADYVAHYAAPLDFRVVVCDPRPDAPAVAAAEFEPAMPDEAVYAWAADPRSAVMTLSHDPRLDDLALLAALPGPSFYVGALGSRRTDEKRRERLRAEGLSEADLDRLHAPLGLPIGSRAPAEIALSAVAELAAVRRGVSSALRRSIRFSEADLP